MNTCVFCGREYQDPYQLYLTSLCLFLHLQNEANDSILYVMGCYKNEMS